MLFKYSTHNSGLERWFKRSLVKFVPVNASKEWVTGYSSLSTLCSHTTQTPGWILCQKLSKTKKS